MRVQSSDAYANRKAPSNSTTGVRGVTEISPNKFRARVYHNGKPKILGYRETIEEASKLIEEWTSKQ